MTRTSIGDDTTTGEPQNGPRGPYITDKDDGTHAGDKKSASDAGTKATAPTPPKTKGPAQP